MYYLAKEQDSAPFVTFEHVANSIEELEKLGLNGDPLVVTEARLFDPNDPNHISFEFGVCHKRIVNGQLQPAIASAISEAESNLTKSLNIERAKAVGIKLDARTFRYGANDFPLNPSAITVYQAVIKKGVQNPVISQQGQVVLEVSDLVPFENAMLNAIIGINAESVW